MELSVVIPCYNEEKRIAPTLNTLFVFLNHHQSITEYEVIIVDDGSKDNTLKVIPPNPHLHVIPHQVNQGKGGSVRTGVLNAKYENILFMDSDLATPIEELNRLSPYLQQGYDIIIASRNLPGSNLVVKQPKYRQLAGKTFPLLVRLLSGLPYKDTQCGFKLMKAGPGKEIFKRLTILRFAFDVEMLFIAKRLGYRTAEVPVNWIDQSGSTVHFFRDSWRMLKDLFTIRINDWKGRYAR